ncbi:MAG: cyanophycin synthetase [Akkermansiaceae bacterium]|nr:cyanophycin synthetase [Akkermansiaceae bacterium]
MSSQPSATRSFFHSQKVLVLRGPNRWTRATVIEGWVRFLPVSSPAPDWRDRLLDWQPALASRLTGGPPPAAELLATLLHDLTRHLQARPDLTLDFVKVAPTSQPDLLRVIVQYDEETVGRAAFALACRMLETALAGAPLEVAAAMAELTELADDLCLGPSTRSMVDAALSRGIPVRRLTEGSLVQLGWGSKQRKILAAATSHTSAIAEDIVQDKDLTCRLLREVGLPVPIGRPVASAEAAWTAALEIGLPVVVKPLDGNQGRGVALNLSTREQVLTAYQSAFEESDSVIVESFAPGGDYRLLVVGRQLVAASRRRPAHVIGDGEHTVNGLIELANLDPLRAPGHAAVLSVIRIDAVALAVLADQGLAPDSVPEAGRLVLIRRNANLSTGGTAADCTEEVHPTIRDAAIEAAQTVGLDICGIDIVARDISQPLGPDNGVIIELNARPGLRMHLAPSDGKPRNVGEAVISTLFNPGEDGRIPIVAVTGVNGKTTTARFIAHLLGQSGWRVGSTSTDEVIVGGRILDHRDCSGPKSARSVLAYPGTDAAVLEIARGGVLREGLPFDRCDVAVVTNIGAGDHLGIAEIHTPEELAAVKQTVVAAVSPTGTAVLNATDPLVVRMAVNQPCRALFFAIDGNHETIVRHRADGGRAIFVRDGWIIRAEGVAEAPFIALAEVPLTHGGRIHFQIENTLAAIGAAWSLGIADEFILGGAASFNSGMDHCAGRFNMLDFRGIQVIIDYAHNVDALRSLFAAIQQFPHERRIIVYSSAGDRRDSDIVEQGSQIALHFDEVWLYEGDYVRGRPPGEIMTLIAAGLDGSQRVRRIEHIQGHLQAVDLALASANPGDLVMIQADTARETVHHLRGKLASLAVTG